MALYDHKHLRKLLDHLERKGLAQCTTYDVTISIDADFLMDEREKAAGKKEVGHEHWNAEIKRIKGGQYD